jgi:transcriptional regulator with XRE-family HTH domain
MNASDKPFLLSRIRRAYGLSQQEMAKLLGCARSTISRLEEGGERDPETLRKGKYGKVLTKMHELWGHKLIDEKRLLLVGRALVDGVESLFDINEGITYLKFLNSEHRVANEALLFLVLHASSEEKRNETVMQRLAAGTILRMMGLLLRHPEPEYSEEQK